MTKQEIRDVATRLGGVLAEMGCEYSVEANERTGTWYIYVRQPRYLEIRISDHKSSGRKSRYKRFDVGPHGLAPEDAPAEIARVIKLPTFIGTPSEQNSDFGK